MGQILVRQLDDRDLDRLRARAKAMSTSVEALVREAIRKEAQLTVTEKMDLVHEMQSHFAAARVAGTPQTLGVDLIREDRDRDH